MTSAVINKSYQLNFAFFFLVLFFFCLWSCTPEKKISRKKSGPNVILITVDTLRADHLGCYGYKRNISPRIDAFSRESTLYQRSIAAASWTVPTHASLFTGKYPFEHGAHAQKVLKPDGPVIKNNNVNRLSEDYLTLAETFQREGYGTGAFVANAGYLSTFWQLNQGFDTYHVEHVYAKKLNRHIFKWLAANNDKNFFLFINYMDTHAPYNAEPPAPLQWFQRIYEKFRHGIGASAGKDSEQLMQLLYYKVMAEGETAPRDLVTKVLDQYDTSIERLDRQFGNLLSYLRAMDLYDNTIIVLTSDHGEFFGEHLLVEHGKDVYQEVLWVPLIIKSCGQKEPQIITTLVSSTDIANLILSCCPRDITTRYLTAFSDAPGNHLVISENYYTRTKHLLTLPWGRRFNRVRTAVFDWPYKYIHSTDGNHELYHLENDRKELHNLIMQKPEIAARLSKKVTAFQKERGKSDKIELPQLPGQTLEMLKVLGYIRE